MTIPSAEVALWTQQGSQDAAKTTYEAVRSALTQSSALKDLYLDIDYEIYLQGSYANATNTRGDSDVDVVVMCKSTFYPDDSRLSGFDAAVFANRSRTPGTMTPPVWRSIIHNALSERLTVRDKDKCLFVPKTPGRVDADIVPAFQTRLYTSFRSEKSATFIEGTRIHPISGGHIKNYPKAHKANGQRKNELCNGHYKKTVRQVKRLRRKAVELNRVRPGSMPGYLLECMVYNVPDDLFVADDVDRLRGVMAYLSVHSPEELAERFRSCDEVHMLFTTDPGEHNRYTAANAIAAMWDVL